MNNSRMWLVVNPTVGIPLLLGAVAVTSLIVHAAVLTHTTWYPAFYQGNTKAKVALDVPVQKLSDTAVLAPAGPAAKVVFDSQGKDAVVVFSDGRTARVVFDSPAARPAEVTAMVARPVQ